jgi:two-component system sensor histidine kinase BaeS
VTGAKASATRLGLGSRLALATGLAVGVVILIAGLAVQVAVVERFDAYLADVRQERYAEVVASTAALVQEQGDLRLRKQDLRRLAVLAGGLLVLRDIDGNVVARIDSLPGTGGAAAAAEPPIDLPVTVEGQLVGTLEVLPVTGTAPAGTTAAPRVFRESTVQILTLAGAGVVLASILVTFLLAQRLTRPLRGLAVAARRVEAGDLAVRVPIPADAESHDLAVAFNSMAEGLERSEVLRQRSASDLAHELGTPVTVLTGRLQALADGAVPPDPEHLAAARDTAEEVRRLVGDLQDLVAAEGAVLRRSPSRVDLRTIVSRAAASSQALFDDEGVAVDLSGVEAGAPVDVDADARQLERVLVNLLTNAATYTPPGGAVSLSVSRRESIAQVRVRDTGPGIPEEHMGHVFERFYRADPARRRTPGRPGGSGIGLTVARDLATANGGSLTVESTGPTGTTFLLELPASG